MEQGPWSGGFNAPIALLPACYGRICPYREREVDIVVRRDFFIVCLAVLFMACPVHAIRFPSAGYVPFDRLTANMEAFVRDCPNDPQGYYILARMHYFVFADQLPFVPVRNAYSSFPPHVAEDWLVRADGVLWELRYDQAEQIVLDAWGYATVSNVPSARLSEFQRAVLDMQQQLADQGWKPELLDTDTVLDHAAAAVDNFERALDLDPENGLFYLGLAGLYEQYSSYATDANIADPPPQLAHVTIPKMRVMYYLAYRFSIEEDRTWEYRPTWGLRVFVSYEAGTAYLRLAAMEPSIAEANSVAQVRADLAKLEELPMGPITPIVFSTEAHRSVLDLLDPNTHVTFDLDGCGRDERWPWIKPDTGLLVWDPLNRGKITSGRQLFGTATWWLLFRDGYSVLDALDDDRDGALSGPELKGIGVWFDSNANGRSEPGEVQPVVDFGVQAIGTRSTGFDYGMPMNARGIVLKDGAAVPTYDWLVSPIIGSTE